jgi:DNA-directed RNA polymerase specialized sigma24 family protein
MGHHVIVTNEAYELLRKQKRENYSLKRLASEPIVAAYGKPPVEARQTTREGGE